MTQDIKKHSVKLPIASLIGSFIFLILLSSLTSPQENIAVIPLFFLLIWGFVFSLMLLIFRLLRLKSGYKSKTWLGLITTFLVIVMMLRSTGDIKPLDVLVLLLLASGTSLYINRRL